VLGVDIGGTFTDFSLLDKDGHIALWKEATTPKDPAEAIQRGIRALAEQAEMSLDKFLDRLDLFVHGSTIATNTVIQRNGPKTALLCTEGFRDVIHFRDGFKPDRYNIQLQPPEDFIPRYLRIPIKERVNYTGEVVAPLEEDSVHAAAAKLKNAGVESVAVAFLWSIMNADHEQRVKAIIEEVLPGVPVVLSSDVLPMIREWERTTCTVLSAYVIPGIARYMVELEEFLHGNGFRHPLLIMQLNGGSSTVNKILHRPIYTLASGPAAAPIAGLHCSQRVGMENVITIDMGGTSFDVSMVTDGTPTLTRELRVHNLPVGVAAVDVHSVGAGGGSIAWIDKGGALQVGPQSAGAEPGPACYAQGGTDPTCTDANVVLGYINPDYFLGGRREINVELSERAIENLIAKPLGLTVPEAAHGIFRLINNNMVDAIRVVSIERGIDPRHYSLVVGGGAGAIHAGMLGRTLGMKTAIIPRYSGVFCSVGMIVSDVRHDYMQAFATNTERFDLEGANKVIADLERKALDDMIEEGFPEGEVTLTRFADAKYPAQIHELTVPLKADGPLTEAHIGDMAEAFHDLHERMFSYSVRESSVDLFHWRVIAHRAVQSPQTPELPVTGEPVTTVQKGTRRVYFGDIDEYRDTNIYDGDRLNRGMMITGPAVVEQQNTTIVVFPGQKLEVNAYGDFVLEL
ncbi:MAG: hydantoinase/oxoprolinase family protein, partial [Gammaproteobacteria bacterium]|nr:hydantoinase/oxoprolinase family protein [Gammaproteobacteria bacterium]